MENIAKANLVLSTLKETFGPSVRPPRQVTQDLLTLTHKLGPNSPLLQLFVHRDRLVLLLDNFECTNVGGLDELPRQLETIASPLAVAGVTRQSDRLQSFTLEGAHEALVFQYIGEDAIVGVDMKAWLQALMR